MGRKWMLAGLLGLLPLFLLNGEPLQRSAREALALCGTHVVPALLPFFVVSDLLLRLGLDRWLSPWLTPLMALCRLPGAAGSALLLGTLGGYPVGARTAAQLYEQGRLTRAEAEQLLTFCSCSNPVFLVSLVGMGLFGSLSLGVLLWLIHLLAALITGLLLCRGKSESRSAPPATAPPVPDFLPALAQSLSRGGQVMVSVCACVVFFYTMLTPLRQQAGHWATALIGMTELFSLVPRLAPDGWSLVLASGCVGWGGLSVLAQCAAALGETDLSPRPLLLGKALQGLLAAGLTWALLPLLLN